MRDRVGAWTVCLIIGLPFWLAAPQAQAGCEMPIVPPIDVLAGPLDDGARLHIVSGEIGFCDAGIREFDIDLPALPGIRDAKVRLALGGFTRKYGVHQIGFTLQSEAVDVTPKGVKIRYTALIDGLDHYQLAYTLYVAVHP